MKTREFNRAVKELSTTEGRGKNKRTFIDVDKVKAAPEELKGQLARFLVSKRRDVPRMLLPDNYDSNPDWAWARSCAYLYYYEKDGIWFVSTSESRDYQASLRKGA